MTEYTEWAVELEDGGLISSGWMEGISERTRITHEDTIGEWEEVDYE